MTDAIKIDVWSDIACPWCYIGKRNLEKGLAEASADDDAPVVGLGDHVPSFLLRPVILKPLKATVEADAEE